MPHKQLDADDAYWLGCLEGHLRQRQYAEVLKLLPRFEEHCERQQIATENDEKITLGVIV